MLGPHLFRMGRVPGRLGGFACGGVSSRPYMGWLGVWHGGLRVLQLFTSVHFRGDHRCLARRPSLLQLFTHSYFIGVHKFQLVIHLCLFLVFKQPSAVVSVCFIGTHTFQLRSSYSCRPEIKAGHGTSCVRGLEGGRNASVAQSDALAEDGSEADPGRARPCASRGTPIRNKTGGGQRSGRGGYK